MWEETFADFNYEIRNLAMKYPFDIVKRKLAKLKEEKEGKDS